MLLRAVLAAFIGAAVMTISSTTEMNFRERPASVTPGRAANKILSVVGIPELKGRSLEILSTWTHWLYGTGWGIVFWLLIDVAGLSLGLTAILFLLIVWGAEQIELPVLGLAPPGWKWGAKEVLIDLGHHVAYVGGTVLGWVLIGLA